MKDFDEPGSLAPTGLHLGGTKYMVIQGEPGAVIRGKKVCTSHFICSMLENVSHKALVLDDITVASVSFCSMYLLAPLPSVHLCISNNFPSIPCCLGHVCLVANTLLLDVSEHKLGCKFCWVEEAKSLISFQMPQVMLIPLSFLNVVCLWQWTFCLLELDPWLILAHSSIASANQSLKFSFLPNLQSSDDWRHQICDRIAQRAYHLNIVALYYFHCHMFARW